MILLTAALLPLGAWLSLQARIDSEIARNIRGDLHAFYVAEAGIARALAILDTLPSAAVALLGPDGVSGTPDDGGLIAAPATAIFFPESPYFYTLTVEPAGADMVRVHSTAHGWGGAVKQLEVVVLWRAGQLRSWWREVL